MTTITLTEGLSLQDYINAHTTDVTVRALLSIFTHPQVNMDDDISLQSYLDTEVSVKLDEENVIPADGFNAAYCQNTFCVGFESSDIWQKDQFDLIITSNGKSKNVSWLCISSPHDHCTEEQRTHREMVFKRWLQERNVVLIESSLLPEQKPIDVEGDHGQQELKDHAKVLNRHPYVNGVLTSLPFRPKSKDYILNITDDGLIDIVLWWEDAGYSMRVKTTGRNVAETMKIANLLKEKYGKHK